MDTAGYHKVEIIVCQNFSLWDKFLQLNLHDQFNRLLNCRLVKIKAKIQIYRSKNIHDFMRDVLLMKLMEFLFHSLILHGSSGSDPD